MANITPLQLGGIFAVVLVLIGGGALLISNLAGHQRDKQPRDSDINDMFTLAAEQGWKRLEGFSLLGSYEITGEPVAGQGWVVRYEMTKESRFGGGKDNTSQAKLVPNTRWMSSEPRPDSGVVLIWPRPENMPSDVSGQPGADLKIGNFNLGRMIVDTVISHDYGADGKQFKDAEIMKIGSVPFMNTYAILSNNRALTEQLLNEDVMKIMEDWSSRGLTAEPPQLLLWDKGVEISVAEKVTDFVVLEKMVALGDAVVKALSK